MSATEKVSVTLGREELRHAKRLASRLGLSLSTFINEAVRARLEQQARREAGLEVLSEFSPEDRASPSEMRALLERWQASASTKRRGAKRRGSRRH